MGTKVLQNMLLEKKKILGLITVNYIIINNIVCFNKLTRHLVLPLHIKKFGTSGDKLFLFCSFY